MNERGGIESESESRKCKKVPKPSGADDRMKGKKENGEGNCSFRRRLLRGKAVKEKVHSHHQGCSVSRDVCTN